jgi:hypothetical protein
MFHLPQFGPVLKMDRRGTAIPYSLRVFPELFILSLQSINKVFVQLQIVMFRPAALQLIIGLDINYQDYVNNSS